MTHMHGDGNFMNGHLDRYHSCPICCERSQFVSKNIQIAGGNIYVCSVCSGYFLYPPVMVNYCDSSWTSMRVEQWQRDAERGKRHVQQIVDWFFEKTGRLPRTVLEIGCGSGFMGAGFDALNIAYFGVDVDQASVEFAKSKGINVTQIGAEELPSSLLGKSRFDLILSSNALEHVKNPIKAFESVRLLLNGLAVLIVPNPEGALPRAKANPLVLSLIQRIVGNKRVIAYSIDGYWHNIAYSRRTLHHLCQRAGLKVRKLRTIGINDDVFGFVQPNSSLLYRMASNMLSALDLDSQLILVVE